MVIGLVFIPITNIEIKQAFPERIYFSAWFYMRSLLFTVAVGDTDKSLLDTPEKDHEDVEHPAELVRQREKNIWRFKRSKWRSYGEDDLSWMRKEKKRHESYLRGENLRRLLPIFL